MTTVKTVNKAIHQKQNIGTTISRVTYRLLYNDIHKLSDQIKSDQSLSRVRLFATP